MDEIKEQFEILNGNLEEIDDTLSGIADRGRTGTTQRVTYK